jgi:hypothetical protein
LAHSEEAVQRAPSFLSPEVHTPPEHTPLQQVELEVQEVPPVLQRHQWVESQNPAQQSASMEQVVSSGWQDEPGHAGEPHFPSQQHAPLLQFAALLHGVPSAPNAQPEPLHTPLQHTLLHERNEQLESEVQ